MECSHSEAVAQSMLLGFLLIMIDAKLAARWRSRGDRGAATNHRERVFSSIGAR